VLSSEMEGGANVISEAVTAGVPVIASRVSGSMGLLKPGYPGFFPAGNTRALARLLERVEQNPGFYKILRQRCLALKPLFTPAREKRTWRAILGEVMR
jgi:glycosyltransferase involved in cell wall biosynthesis